MLSPAVSAVHANDVTVSSTSVRLTEVPVKDGCNTHALLVFILWFSSHLTCDISDKVTSLCCPIFKILFNLTSKKESEWVSVLVHTVQEFSLILSREKYIHYFLSTLSFIWSWRLFLWLLQWWDESPWQQFNSELCVWTDIKVTIWGEKKAWEQTVLLLLTDSLITS